MGQNKGGYNLVTLKDKITEVVNFKDSSVQAYLTKIQSVDLPKVA